MNVVMLGCHLQSVEDMLTYMSQWPTDNDITDILSLSVSHICTLQVTPRRVYLHLAGCIYVSSLSDQSLYKKLLIASQATSYINVQIYFEANQFKTRATSILITLGDNIITYIYTVRYLSIVTIQLNKIYHNCTNCRLNY